MLKGLKIDDGTCRQVVAIRKFSLAKGWLDVKNLCVKICVSLFTIASFFKDNGEVIVQLDKYFHLAQHKVGKFFLLLDQYHSKIISKPLS